MRVPVASQFGGGRGHFHNERLSYLEEGLGKGGRERGGGEG